MATFLMLNGIEINAAVDEQEKLILDLAAGLRNRVDMTMWLQNHTKELDPDSSG